MNATVPKIYVVDDDPSICEGVGSLVRSAGFRVEAFGTAREALRRVQAEPPSCMVLDVELPGLSGIELQAQMADARIAVPIIFLTGKGDIPMSVRAIKAGAVEFLTKPCVDDYLLQAIRQGIGQNRGVSQSSSADRNEIVTAVPVGRRRASRHTSTTDQIVGRSPALLQVLSRVNKVAPTCSSVLITGETGTGKELVARAIHQSSKRSGGPFIAVNCGAIPSSLIASELFGHEKGSFTGALQRRLGRFEQADGGTIFLDEIGELSLDVQAALLRVLQEREFERVGGAEIVRTDVRVIAATHRDLLADMDSNKFRSDLFYRLNVYPIEVPPLRARREDIPALVNFFVERNSNLTGSTVRRVDPDSMKLLKAYPWPGNIRELQNVIERGLILCESETLVIDRSFFISSAASKASGQALNSTLLIQEKEMIEKALRESKGRVSGPWGAAAKLGLAPSTLESKILSLKIDKYQFKTVTQASSAGEVLMTV